MEHELLAGLVTRRRVTGASTLETAKLTPPSRGVACGPLFWFPPTVNGYVIRLIAIQVFVAGVVCVVANQEEWAKYIRKFLFC